MNINTVTKNFYFRTKAIGDIKYHCEYDKKANNYIVSWTSYDGFRELKYGIDLVEKMLKEGHWIIINDMRVKL